MSQWSCNVDVLHIVFICLHLLTHLGHGCALLCRSLHRSRWQPRCLACLLPPRLLGHTKVA